MLNPSAHVSMPAQNAGVICFSLPHAGSRSSHHPCSMHVQVWVTADDCDDD